MPVDGKTNLVSQIRLENRFRFSNGVLRNQVAYLLEDQIFLCYFHRYSRISYFSKLYTSLQRARASSNFILLISHFSIILTLRSSKWGQASFEPAICDDIRGGTRTNDRVFIIRP